MEEHGQKYSTADHAQDNADGDFEGAISMRPATSQTRTSMAPAKPYQTRFSSRHLPENAHDIGHDQPDEGEVAYLHNRD